MGSNLPLVEAFKKSAKITRKNGIKILLTSLGLEKYKSISVPDG